MKIGIVTIYKCYNYGSFYQAYGLFDYLKSLGHDVYFLHTECSYNFKYRFHKQFNRDISRDFFDLKLSLKYLKDWSLYKVAKKNDSDFDAVIVGSDEIWNIKNRSFLPDKRYYGLSLDCKNVFNYATCVGSSTVEDFKEDTEFFDGLKALKNISARDDATEDFLKAVTGKNEIPRVIDPSFLADWSKIEARVDLKNYILVYTYDGLWGFSDEYIKATRAFAKDKGLPLVSVGFKNDWCDIKIAASPREFLGYLRNADFVVTDTFHGTAMSVQYNKQFVSMGKGKKKVESLLKEFGISDRIFSTDNSFEDITKTPIDYKTVNGIIKEKKAISQNYLGECING